MGARLFIVAALAVIAAGLLVPVLAVKLLAVIGLLLAAMAVMAWGVREIRRGENDG